MDLTTDQYCIRPTPNRIDYPLIVNNTHVYQPRQDFRFIYLATHKSLRNSNSYPSFGSCHTTVKF